MSGIATQADIDAIDAQGWPTNLPASTYEMICRGAALDPLAPALSFFMRIDDHRNAQCWSYRELVRDITRTANFFHRLGVRPGKVVAYVLPNLPQTHFTIWGGEAAGIVCALNPLLEAAAIARLLNAAQAEVLVTLAPLPSLPGADLWPRVQPVLDQITTLRHLVLVDLAGRARTPEQSAAHPMERDEYPGPHGRDVSSTAQSAVRRAVPAHVAIHDFDQAIARESGDGLDSNRRFDPEDYSSYFCTGGTTGLPKIAMRRHGNEVANVWSTNQLMGAEIRSGKTLFCGLPLFHVNAVQATGLGPFSRGAHVVLGTPQGYRGDGVIPRFWELVEYHRINFFGGVPTLYAALLGVPIEGRDISSLEYGMCGAAPMPVEVFRAFQERTGIRILEGYGLTEGACVSSVNPPLGERRVGSIGLRLPGQAMKAVVVDGAGRYVRDCVANETGLIVIAGPNVFAGYLQPEQNEGLWLKMGDGRRWLNTGDLGRADGDGYFWLTGRKKDLIIRGGHNIDPAAIEEPLHRHPAVQIAAAVGRPDAHAGELPVAYVQLKVGAQATEQDLAEFVRDQIGERAALPKAIRIVDAIPLTAVGKIFKPALKRLETIEALRSALAQAGVPDATVTIGSDTSRGLSVHVMLAKPGFDAQAREVLGRFALAFTIGVAG